MRHPTPDPDEAVIAAAEWEASAGLIELPTLDELAEARADAARDTVAPGPTPFK
jgi:hypothetical protein